MNLLLIALLASCVQAQTQVGDLQVTGQVGVNSPVPKARFDVKVSTADEYGLRVSSADGSALLIIDKAGKTGVGVGSPGTTLDVRGSGDDGRIGLQLRVGNSSSSMSSSQLIFALVSSDTHRHSIRSRATAGQNPGNALDFYLWRSTDSPWLLGAARVMSLEASVALSSGSVHIHPFGDPTSELVVSNGLTMGGGTIHRANSYILSTRSLKREITYLGAETLTTALEELKALRHVRFRYRNDPPDKRHRGLIFEEAPTSIQDPSGGLVVNERITNVEMALQAVHQRVTALESLVSDMERRGR